MKLGIQPVECRAHIVLFAVAVVMRALASTDAAEVETQYGKTETAKAFMAW